MNASQTERASIGKRVLDFSVRDALGICVRWFGRTCYWVTGAFFALGGIPGLVFDLTRAHSDGMILAAYIAWILVGQLVWRSFHRHLGMIRDWRELATS